MLMWHHHYLSVRQNITFLLWVVQDDEMQLHDRTFTVIYRERDIYRNYCTWLSNIHSKLFFYNVFVSTCSINKLQSIRQTIKKKKRERVITNSKRRKRKKRKQILFPFTNALGWMGTMSYADVANLNNFFSFTIEPLKTENKKKNSPHEKKKKKFKNL